MVLLGPGTLCSRDMSTEPAGFASKDFHVPAVCPGSAPGLGSQVACEGMECDHSRRHQMQELRVKGSCSSFFLLHTLRPHFSASPQGCCATLEHSLLVSPGSQKA